MRSMVPGAPRLATKRAPAPPQAGEQETILYLQTKEPLMRRYIAMPFLTLILLASILCRPSFAAQNSCVIPTTGTLSGLTLVQDINACHGSMLSVFSGATAPSPATQWMLWQNTANNTV